jgi:hypothetical protein
MSAAKWFDTDAELRKLRSTPAKPAKVAKVNEEDTPNFSGFSDFSGGACPKSQISPPSDPSWTCPHCGRLATIQDVFPSLDGERTLTMWSCEPCQIVAVTPDTVKVPPLWIKRTQQ